MDTIDPYLELISPNGGESWYIGDTIAIQWNAVDTNLGPDGIELWYSLNGGVDYVSIAEAIANSGSYAWELPASQSLRGKVQIQASDTFGNSALVSSLSLFSISYAPPAIPEGLTVDISNGVDALLNWEEVTQSIPPYNNPIIPDGYIILYNESPYEDDEHFYYFLGRSYTTQYTHYDVAEFRDQMFYKVSAYKNYTREDIQALEALLQESKTQRIPWIEAKAILRGGKQ